MACKIRAAGALPLRRRLYRDDAAASDRALSAQQAEAELASAFRHSRCAFLRHHRRYRHLAADRNTFIRRRQGNQSAPVLPESDTPLPDHPL